MHDGIVRRSKTKALPVKILGSGDAPTGVTIHAHAFSRSALDKLAAAGSTAQRISWPDGNPIDEEAEARAAAEAAAVAAKRKRAKATKGKATDDMASDEADDGADDAAPAAETEASGSTEAEEDGGEGATE
jgi:hypothetical protein